MFVEHYVDVPEDKYDVIDELANRLDEMEEKLDNEVHKNMEIVEENDSLKRQNVVREACEDLSESQQEKMVSLSNGVDFTDQEDFAEKGFRTQRSLTSQHLIVKLSQKKL